MWKLGGYQFLSFLTWTGPTCLWPMFCNTDIWIRPSLSSSRLHTAGRKTTSSCPPCFGGWGIRLSDGSCQGNLFGMQANNPSPNSLSPPGRPGAPVRPQALHSSGHTAAQPPWKSAWNCSSSYQRRRLLIQIVLLKSFTKTAVVNRAGELCKKLPLGKP